MHQYEFNFLSSTWRFCHSFGGKYTIYSTWKIVKATKLIILGRAITIQLPSSHLRSETCNNSSHLSYRSLVFEFPHNAAHTAHSGAPGFTDILRTLCSLYILSFTLNCPQKESIAVTSPMIIVKQDLPLVIQGKVIIHNFQYVPS